MKVIEQNGFLSAFGGYPSPILPYGKIGSSLKTNALDSRSIHSILAIWAIFAIIYRRIFLFFTRLIEIMTHIAHNKVLNQKLQPTYRAEAAALLIQSDLRLGHDPIRPIFFKPNRICLKTTLDGFRIEHPSVRTILLDNFMNL
jgi:hypothetical protein